MKKADQWSGLFLSVVAGFACWGSALLPYGNIYDPGPGFLPLWLGIILGVMSSALILRTSWQKGGAKMLGGLFPEDLRWGKVISVLLALFFYSYAMDFVGFLVGTFFFMAFLLWFVDPQPMRSVVVWSLAAALGSYLIFEFWMKLRLPKGFLGI